jgi:hypothetical protein
MKISIATRITARVTAAALSLTLLAACSTDNNLPPPRTDYGLPPKISMDVQSINLVDRNPIQSVSSPYNSNHFQPTIDEAIRQWAKDRLQAVGPVGQAVVIIKDASLNQESVPHDTDWFTRQQGSKYIAHAEVELEAKGHEGYALATAQANRFETLPDNPTEAERQAAYYKILNELMKDLGQNLEASIQTHMRDFLVSAPVLAPSMAPISTPVAMPVPVSTDMPAYYSAQPVTPGGQPIAPALQSSGYPGQPGGAYGQ